MISITYSLGLPALTMHHIAAADAPATVAGAKKYGWTFEDETNSSRRRRQSLIKDLPVAAIRRPMGRTRENGKQPGQLADDCAGLCQPHIFCTASNDVILS